jgi:hypothetical protein
MHLQLLYRPTNTLQAWIREDDQIPVGLDRSPEGYYVVEVIQLEPPELQPGEQAIPAAPVITISDPDGQGINGTATLGWEVLPAPPPPPPAPQWLEFVTWLYGQPAMMAAMGAARASTSPQGEPATTALPAALEAARNEGNYPAFALTWGQFLLASGLPVQTLAPIVAKAQELHLPAEFVAALQPAPPTP